MLDWNQIKGRFGDRPLLLGHRALSYGEFLDSVENDALNVVGDLPVLLNLEWDATKLGRLLGAFRAGRDVVLVPGLELERSDLDPFRKGGPLIVLASGGTSGQARHVVHDAARFLSRYAPLGRPPRRQMFLYAAGHLAGLDAFLQAFHRGASLVIPAGTGEGVGIAIESEKVQVLAATPSQLQLLMLSGAFAHFDCASLEAVVYGAEPMPAPTLQRLREQLPKVQFEQRFGMSELGTLPVRSDPEDHTALYLDPPHRWKVEDGELYLSTTGRMLGTLQDGPLPEEGWFATGDLAEQTPQGSIRILGRLNTQINVGGLKVLPERVESVLLEIPGITDACVRGEPDPLTGQRLVAELVVSAELDITKLRALIRRHCVSVGLPLAAIPSKVKLVDSIERTVLGKRQRAMKGNA
jgi:acyl-coenzyme A synthetase/AMP-(fatty) acid ligase